MRLIPGLAAAAAMTVLAAGPVLAQKSRPSKPQEYQVTFVFDRTYTGSMSLEIRQGKVSGKMAIDAPEKVTGTVAGTLKGDTLALDYPYEIQADQPCTGRVTVNATFNAARTEAKGTTHSEGCGDPQDGQFTMTKPAKER